MGKIATVELGWSKSTSPNVKAVQVITTIAGVVATVDVAPEVESIQVDVAAGVSGTFQVRVVNTDGLEAMSLLYSFTIDSLEAPQPATGLFHKVIGVRDDAPAPDAPPAA